ncbi:helix-turn-helix domain-containing protein [Ensifer adhaerens]|uniref:helix-turn-helix domain-containing protein n=1 Tax=Ensifer adhaerens TaxID=106592 RepID=UPI001CC03E16|nr:helix-turn-helix transcriptional regulator [Ensifer adhaerens]MBZ7921635.1 helix-turn-helix domain-containing protein [Ensifer adhaerens]UAX94054.1 helix-turn-helix domain-containing protein [Ensifer adhaerens]UAY01688.1 helix-turn-helix domain-containing protein [Ensifer adhaerens]UAY09072.1 helix-turn-helix domain-containing protein [Ensifer adhaerens]
MENKSPIARYREEHELTLKEFGALFDVDQSTALRWERGLHLSAKKAIEIEAKTGISRHALLPDIFGPPPAAKVEAAE